MLYFIKEWEVSTTAVDNLKLNWLGTQDWPMLNNQDLEIAFGNQMITIKQYLEKCLQREDSRKKFNIQSNINVLHEKNC